MARRGHRQVVAHQGMTTRSGRTRHRDGADVSPVEALVAFGKSILSDNEFHCTQHIHVFQTNLFCFLPPDYWWAGMLLVY